MNIPQGIHSDKVFISYLSSLAATWNACDSSPCKNGGTCVNSGDSYSCACADGFDSTNCDLNINDCSRNPCHNGGRCIDEVNWHRCECLKGYAGPDCRIKINSCASNPCSYGSTCLDLAKGAFHCMCPPGRTGDKCDFILGNELQGSLLDEDLNSASCYWEGEWRPHVSLWHHHCNTCHCSNGQSSCTDVWCGPQNCKQMEDPAKFCSSVKVRPIVIHLLISKLNIDPLVSPTEWLYLFNPASPQCVCLAPLSGA